MFFKIFTILFLVNALNSRINYLHNCSTDTIRQLSVNSCNILTDTVEANKITAFNTTHIMIGGVIVENFVSDMSQIDHKCCENEQNLLICARFFCH